MDQNTYDLNQEEIANDKWMAWYNADKQIAEDRALEMLWALPTEEFKQTIIASGGDITPADLAVKLFFDDAWREIRESDPLEG